MPHAGTFFEAASTGNGELVKKLLAYGGMQPDATNEVGNQKTGLMHAAMDGEKELVALLLGNGKHIEAQDKVRPR